MPDIVRIDDEGFLTVVGRHSDFIIRAGHNVSAQAVEEQLLEYPRIALAAVVGMPDEVVGERVCAYVTTKDGQRVGLDEIVAFLSSQGVSKTMWPERVVHLDEIPTGVGAKAAKAVLAEDIRRRLAEEGGERQSPGH